MTNELLQTRHRVSEVTNVDPDLAQLGNSQPLIMHKA